MNPFKKYRIDYLLFGIFGGFILFLLIVAVWTSYALSSRELLKNTYNYQQILLNEINKQLSISLSSVEQLSLAASRNLELKQFLSEEENEYAMFKRQLDMELYLAQIAYSTPMIDSIHLYVDKIYNPRSGHSVVQLIHLAELKKENWYPIVEHTDFAWIGEHRQTTNQRTVDAISFARKMYSEQGQYLGMLVVHIKAETIKQLLTGGLSEQTPNRVLLDSGGRLVASSGDKQLKLEIDPYFSQLETSSGFKKIRLEGQLRRQPYLMVWSKFYNSNWLLVELTPTWQITSGSRHIASILVFIGFAAIIAALFFTLIVSRQFTKPIGILLDAMAKFAIERRLVELPAGYRNEFGVMFNGYRKLRESVIELYDSLKEQYRRKKEAEINALQAMINPHFLYNTLDQLNWMAIEQGQEKISHVLELMGRMFRIGLSNGERYITIRDELTYLECYIQIQQIRWGEGLEFRVEVPETFMNLYIPKMTLQPFVENAVVHGLHGLESGLIEIKATEFANGLLFTVTDNGSGFSTDWHKTPGRKTGGYGIRNVKERMNAYGDGYGLEISRRCEGGTEVKIRLPIIHNKSEMTN